MLFRISVGFPSMLYKSLILLYGSSLAGKSSPSDDLVWHFTPSEDLRRFREYALDALQQAEVYLLDHLEAAYADTLHEAVAKEAADVGLPAMEILGEVKLPADVVWVELDDQALGVARFDRASPVTRYDDNPIGTGLRGYLLDTRNPAHLRITMFHRRENSRVVDPIMATQVSARSSSPIPRHDEVARPNTTASCAGTIFSGHIFGAISTVSNCPTVLDQPAIEVFTAQRAHGDRAVIPIGSAYVA